jgi:hypothetical protein
MTVVQGTRDEMQGYVDLRIVPRVASGRLSCRLDQGTLTAIDDVLINMVRNILAIRIYFDTPYIQI